MRVRRWSPGPRVPGGGHGRHGVTIPTAISVSLRLAIADLHGVEPSFVLPGNGAAELFTWLARDASGLGSSLLLAPGFADYRRALRCWSAPLQEQALPLTWSDAFPQAYPDPIGGSVLWICNPHNPTGQLWSRARWSRCCSASPW